jgi:hypothetical protein
MRAALFGLLLSSAVGCETETEPLYGEPDEVVGATSGASQGATTSTTNATTTTSSVGAGGDGGGSSGSGGAGGGGVCDPSAPCAVSFGDQIYPVLTTSCRGTGFCHGDTEFAASKFAVTTKSATYDATTTYSIDAGQNYVVPCDPANSKILCNIVVPGGDHGAACGKAMPPMGQEPADGVDAAELDLLSQWIACGAPNN